MESLKTFKYFICLMIWWTREDIKNYYYKKIGIYLFNPLYIDGFKSTFKTKVYNSKKTNLFIFFNVYLENFSRVFYLSSEINIIYMR